MELDKVCTTAAWPEPTCHCDIQVFLGFANFYICFIDSFLRLAKLMTDMLKRGKNGCFSEPFQLTLSIKQSFVELCDAFTKALILAHFDPAKLKCLETNALEFAIAGMISQQQDKVSGNTKGAVCRTKGNKSSGEGYWHTVAFGSWSMSPAEQNYSVSN